MITLKLLKDYGDFKAGDSVTTDSKEDAELLVSEGIAEVQVAKEITPEPEPKIDLVELSKQVADEVKKELKTELKLPAQPKPDKAVSPYKCFGEFAKAVIEPNEKLINYCKATGMSEAVNADGGFLIPSEFSTALLTAMANAGTLAPKTLNFPVNNNLTLPFVNLTTQATSWTGGVTVYKPAEGIQKTGSKPALAQAELKLHKMTALVYATDELLNDSPMALQTFLNTMVSTELALTKDEDIINGSGAGEALGVMNSPCLVSVAKETGQAAATLEYANVLKMWMRLNPTSRSNAVWLIASDAMEQIGKLSVSVGTGGAPVMVVNAATNLPQTLFGAPIIWSPHCQTLGTAGDIILADFSQYVTITKAGAAMESATSIHLKFDYDETAFRFVVRFDGQPWWSSAVTPKHGSSTVSPFVSLAVRE